MVRPVVMLIGTALGLCGLSAHAGEPNPWSQREAPGGFLFDNEFDAHQRSQQARDGSLFGLLCVRFSGATTQDGYPVATHVDCGTVPNCSVGCKLDGKPMKATFLHHAMQTARCSRWPAVTSRNRAAIRSSIGSGRRCRNLTIRSTATGPWRRRPCALRAR